MAFLNPRYNGRVGVYRTNEIERFAYSVTPLTFNYTNTSSYVPYYGITEDSNRIYVLQSDSNTPGDNIIRTYTSGFTQSYTFSCTASVIFTSIYAASDGWLYATGFNSNKKVISQMSITGSNYREIYSDTGALVYSDNNMIELNNRIYCYIYSGGSDGIKVISASGSSSSLVASITQIGYYGMASVTDGSYIYYIGQRSVSGGSQMQVLKISGTSILSSPYYTQDLTFPTPQNKVYNVLNASTNGTDIFISYDAGNQYPTSATASFLTSYNISSESFTPKIRLSLYYEAIVNVSYASNNSNYYYSRFYKGPSDVLATYSVYKTADESSSSLVFSDSIAYNYFSNKMSYSTLAGGIISAYNTLPGGSFPQQTTIKIDG
jgi:hypothetical protein